MKIALMVILGIFSGGVIPAAYYAGKGSKFGPSDTAAKYYWLCIGWLILAACFVILQGILGISAGNARGIFGVILQIVIWPPIAFYAYQKGKDARL